MTGMPCACKQVSEYILAHSVLLCHSGEPQGLKEYEAYAFREEALPQILSLSELQWQVGVFYNHAICCKHLQASQPSHVLQLLTTSTLAFTHSTWLG